jgi:hypothetical protein
VLYFDPDADSENWMTYPTVKVAASWYHVLCAPSPKPTLRKATPRARKKPSWHQNPGSPTV